MIFSVKRFVLWSVLLLVVSYSTGYCAVLEPNVHRTLPLMMNRDVEAKGTRIVGGYPAAEGEVPWQVGLLANSGTRLFCGGTLISSDVVLTAAHCLVFGGIVTPNSELHVGYGGLDQSDLPTITAVKDVLVHEDYNAITLDNNIALLILEDPVDNFTSLVFPADLPYSTTEDYTNEEVITSGWGTLSSGGSSPEQLQAVQVEIWSNKNCVDAYATLGWSVTENMLCAGEEDFSKDACQGHSGGPLVKVTNETSEIVGISLFGYGCAIEGYPGVYTRVTKYLDWIRDTVCAANSSMYEYDECIIDVVTEDPCDDGGCTNTTDDAADVVTEDPCDDGGCTNTTDDAAFIMNHKQLLIIHFCAALVLLIVK